MISKEEVLALLKSTNGNPPAIFDVEAITAFRVNVTATSETNVKLGTSQGTSQPISQPISQPTNKDSLSIEEKIISFCTEPRSLTEITAYCGFQDKRKFRERHLNHILGVYIQMTIPDKPTSRFQRYISIPDNGHTNNHN